MPNENVVRDIYPTKDNPARRGMAESKLEEQPMPEDSPVPTLHALRPPASAAAVKERLALDQKLKRWAVDSNWSYSFGPFSAAGAHSARSTLHSRGPPRAEAHCHGAAACPPVATAPSADGSPHTTIRQQRRRWLDSCWRLTL